MNEARANARVALYEGLVISTARLIEGTGGVEIDYDDICQRLRIKVWRGLRSYDPHRSRQTERRYIFCVVSNEKKDILKQVRRGDLFIQDLAPEGSRRDPSSHESLRERFDGRYLSLTQEQAYHEVEMCDVSLPSTLDAEEREIVVRLYNGWQQTEIAELLGLTPDQMRWAMVRLREKLADWKPSAPEPQEDPPEPVAPAPPRAARRASRAAAPAARAA